MQYNFGSGSLYGIPTVDATGTAVVNPTPERFGVLQEVSAEFSFENKMLYGSQQFPVTVGRGKGKVSIKAKAAQIRAALFNSIFFGQTMSNNIVAAKNETTAKAIPATPFTITASTVDAATTFAVPSTGTWSRDLGIIDSSGRTYTRVASAPATGQYTVAAGVYVFAAADTALMVYISYEYTATLATAKQFSLNNQAMGYAPQFMCVLSNQFNGGNMHMRFPACIASKLSMPLKNDDFIIPEFDVDAFADASGNICLIGVSE